MTLFLCEKEKAEAANSYFIQSVMSPQDLSVEKRDVLCCS